MNQLTTGDEHIVAATDREWGELWTVRWEFEAPQQLELTVSGLLDAAAEVFEALEARWDPNLRLIVSDHERVARIGLCRSEERWPGKGAP